MPVARALPVALPEESAERLAALFDAHYDRLYRLARRLATNADAARDLVQETFLKAARSPTAVPSGTENEEAWLVRVLINVSRDEWRKTDVRRRYQSPLAASAPPATSHEAAFVARATIWRALEALPPRRRAIVVMHELEGMTVPAVASLLGITPITVRWHLSRGRRELARILTSRSGDTT